MIMDIWVVTSKPEKYSFLELHYNLKTFLSYKEFGTWLLCADIARPGFVFLDMMVDKVTFFSFQSNPLAEEALNLLNFCVVMPYDDIDLSRKCFSTGAVFVTPEPLYPSAIRSYIEHHIENVNEHDVPIKNCFKGMGVDFTSTENQILHVFSRMKGHKARGETIRKFCWGDQVRQEKNLDTHISNIRKKIEKFGYIITRTDNDFHLQKVGPSQYQKDLDRSN